MSEFIHVYGFKVRPHGAPQERRYLSDIDEKGTHILDWVSETMNELITANKWLDFETSDTTLKVKDVYRPDGETVDGLVRVGHKGDRFSVADADDPDQLRYDKQRDEPVVLPLYYRWYVAKGSQLGMLMTQRSGRYGVKSLLWDDEVRGRFERNFPGLMLDFSPLKPTGVAEAFEEDGRLRGITLTKWTSPTKISKGIQLADPKDVGRMEVSFLAKRGRGLKVVNQVTDWLKGEAEMEGLLELDLSDVMEGGGSLALAMDELELELMIGNRKRRVAVASTEATFGGASYEIHPEFDEVTDYPIFESVRIEAESLQEGLLSSLE